MRSPIASVLVAGAFLLAGASSTAFADKEVTVTTGEHSATIYKTQRDECKKLPGSDQARCMDQVGVTPYNGEREGVVTEEMGSVQAREKCERLNPEERRECLLNNS